MTCFNLSYYKVLIKNLTLDPSYLSMNIRHLLKLLFFLTTSWAYSTVTVNTSLDELDTPSGDNISLREAIRDAAAGDTVLFDSSLSGQILTLTQGQLVINKNLTIDASGLAQGFTIDANGQNTEHRVLLINPNRNVTLNNLTLTGGKATGGYPTRRGGAIHVDGRFGARTTLTLDACTLTRNSAFRGGAVFADGENGGHSTVTILNSTLSHNQSDAEGGAIFNNPFSNGDAELTLTSCTLAHNSGSTGGAIHNHGVPGHPGTSDISVLNCTITENSAVNGGGIDSYDDSESSVTLTLDNTILANNTASNSGPDLNVRDQSSSLILTLTGKNLLSSLDGHSLTEPDITLIADPKLAPLGYYGGPTMTMHPLANSPAIIDNSFNTRTGQRGFNLTGAPTIGAVKFGPVTLVNNNSDSTNTNSLITTLREALADSANIPGAIIRFANALNGNTITLEGSQLEVPGTANGLFIDASSLTNGLTIDANEQSRVLEINPNATVAIHGLSMTRGSAAGDFYPSNAGGAIFADGSGSGNTVHLSLSQCTLFNNYANQGGGIVIDSRNSGSASVSLSQCNLTDNIAGLDGGGIYNNGDIGSANLSLSQCTLFNNFAGRWGGGLFNHGFGGTANANLSQCSFLDNSADHGGGIYNAGFSGSASAYLTQCTFWDNSAKFGDGGGILSKGSFGGLANLDIHHSTFFSNSADFRGGGIFSDGNSGSANTNLKNSILAANSGGSSRDLGEYGDNASTIATGKILITSLPASNTFINQSNFTVVDRDSLMLAPLDYYGGPTQTMVPLFGSPAINAALNSTATSDQRGFLVTDGNPDIGAVEANWSSPTENELALVFHTDPDEDGNSYGMEILLGTDPFIADLNHPNNLAPLTGGKGVTFGRNQDFNFSYKLELYRSFTLEPNSFTMIYSYSISDHNQTSSSSDLTPNLSDENLIILPDSTSEPKAFYQLRIANN